MERYERILLCIDRPDRDYRMLGYTGTIARLAKSNEVHLLHVASEGADLPDEMPREEHAAGEVTPETLRALAVDHLEAYGEQAVPCEVVRGTALIEILRYAHDKDIDLIIVGRSSGGRSAASSEAALARRVTRKATCSVLTLPENARVNIDTILVPVRNSECSANALAVACAVAAASSAGVIAFNVCQVHSGYLRVGTTLEEHQSILETQARRECEKLLRRVDCSDATVTTKCAPDLHGKPVPIILEAIESQAADLVLIGARGRTGAAGVLLGTVTEQLIQRSPVPVLAVKKKGECIGILRALLTVAGQE